MWTVAMSSKFGLELFGKHANHLIQALHIICTRRKQQTEQVLLLLADLVHDKKCKIALMNNDGLMCLLIDTICKPDKIEVSDPVNRQAAEQ